MKTLAQRLFWSVASIVLLVSLAACGGGSSSAPSSSGTAGVTSGAITGFGSVIVNGIEFSRKTGLADDKINLKFEGQANQSEDKLKTGMMVKITGTFNSTTGRGEYEAIEFQPELRGRLDDNGVDLANNRLTIMGRQVQIEANTQFDSVRDLAELSADQGLNAHHPEIEVSGNLDNSGVLHATRVSKKNLDFATGAAEIKGAIAAAPAPTVNGFSIGTKAIAVDNNTVFSKMLRADLPTAAGVMVEVKGTLDAGTGVFTATRIEKKNALEAEINDNVRAKGTAAGAISGNTFTLNGPNGPVTVDVSGASFFNGKAPATSAIVTAGAVLEVEGTLNASGTLVATKVEIELEKNVKLEGNAGASAFNAANSTLTLNGVTVNIVSTTRLLDASANPSVALSLAAIAQGDHLQIVGFLTASGAVQASSVQKTKASNLTLIQAPVSAKTATTLTMLGITIDTATIVQPSDFIDNSGASKVPGSGTLAQAQAAFFAKITAGTSVVKAKGTLSGTTLSASEVEIEKPE